MRAAKPVVYAAVMVVWPFAVGWAVARFLYDRWSETSR